MSEPIECIPARIDSRVEVIIRGVQPYSTMVKTTSFSLVERTFRPQVAEVSWTHNASHPDDLSWPSVKVRGRCPRRGSADNYQTGADAFIEYSADDAEGVSCWPVYVQLAFMTARGLVNP